MTPKLTKQMQEAAIADGAEVKDKRKVAKPPERAPAPVTPITPDQSAEIEALRAEIAQLKQSLEVAQDSSQARSQELTALLAGLSDNKPMRLKPIRDMDRESPTYLLAKHYDIVPVTYKPRKLDS